MGKENASSNKSNDSKFSWYLENSMDDYANRQMKNFISNQLLQNEITSFNSVSGNTLNAKILDLYLRELLTNVRITCISQDKQLKTLPQQKNLVYRTLSRICVAIKSAREASMFSEDENSLVKSLSVFDQKILLLGQFINTYFNEFIVFS